VFPAQGRKDVFGSILAHTRDRLVRGLLLLLPLVITVWLLRLVFGIVSGNFTPIVVAALRAAGIDPEQSGQIRFVIPLIGLCLTLLTVYLVGVIGVNLLGRRIFAAFERGILKVPLVRSIYGASRQLLDAFSVGSQGGFSRVVVVEYPRRGVWTIGFVTNEISGKYTGAAADARFIAVFLPTSPNPTSGWLALVPAEDVRDLPLTIEEGITLIVSGGIVTPRIGNAGGPAPVAAGSPDP
jgi:uncharacterized membrane protein